MRAAITEAELTSEERAAELVVRGFASRPEVQRGNRNGIYVFVNKRLVRDRLILHAIHEAYRNVLPPAVFPAVLLFLDLPAEEVDVNVHPAKIEVRFRHPQFVHDFTRDSIRQALSRARPIPSFAGVAPAAAGTGRARERRRALPPLRARANRAQDCRAPSFLRWTRLQSAPPMNAASATGAAIAGDFELTVAPLRPEAQRFRFESGIGTASEESLLRGERCGTFGDGASRCASAASAEA